MYPHELQNVHSSHSIFPSIFILKDWQCSLVLVTCYLEYHIILTVFSCFKWDVLWEVSVVVDVQIPFSFHQILNKSSIFTIVTPFNLKINNKSFLYMNFVFKCWRPSLMQNSNIYIIILNLPKRKKSYSFY